MTRGFGQVLLERAREKCGMVRCRKGREEEGEKEGVPK